MFSPSLDHTDLRAGNWVDRLLPAGLRPYARLARLDRPIGIWLLLFPCWWSIALAAPDGLEGMRLGLLFGLGAIVMRGAGCTLNDIFDRHIDAEVTRTRTRPLPSGQVSVLRALLFLAILLALGFGVLIQLNPHAIALGAAALVPVAIYPLMKRITWWPQFFLGLAFNWGALLGWTAVTGTLALPPVLLYGAGIAWTLGYDTIYAYQDAQDDRRIGVKSSALALGCRGRQGVAGLYALAWAGIGAAAVSAGGRPVWLLAALLPAGAHLGWQVITWQPDKPADCLEKFRSNRGFGWLVLAAILAGRLASS